MAVVEVYKGTSYAGTYGYLNTELYDMANFFSQSAHFTIIDSYSSHYDANKGGSPSYTIKRHKGDPIGDDDTGQPGYKYWESDDDVGETNDWIVVQCETSHPSLAVMGYSGLQKWQCKFQVRGDSYNFQDPSDTSGVKYPKLHNGRRLIAHRFGPYGGWDLADVNPDFDPASPPSSGNISTQNHKEDGSNGSGRPVRWIQIHANGGMIRIARYNDGTRAFYQIMSMIGDVLPVDITHMPMPRCAFGNGDGQSNIFGEDGDGRFLSAGSYKTNDGSDYSTTDGAGGGIAFWDNNEELIEEAFTMDEKSHWNYAIVNPHSPTPEMDLFPVAPIPFVTLGQWFSWPYTQKGFALGVMPYHSKQWVSLGHGYGPFFVWDGSSDIY